MTMELRHLRYFVVLAQELHFGRAAKRLAITQPPLSLNIRQLEEDVGARLFDRDHRRVRLTAAGAAFRVEAEALLARAEQARLLAREIGAGAVGRLRIGFVGSVLYRGLPQWLAEFRADHPRIDVALSELNSQDQIDALGRGELDVGFIHTDRLPPGLGSAPVHADTFLACVHEDHRLAARRRIALAEFDGEPFVLFSRTASPDYYARILALCRAAGFTPGVRHEVRHWLSVVSLVGQGIGVSVVPEPLRRAGIAGAVFRPLADAAPPSDVYCAWAADADEPARAAFLQIVARAATARG